MTIRTQSGSYELTESDLQTLALRFEIRYDGETQRRLFFVDGVEVTEAEYNRQYERRIHAEAC